MIFWENTPQCCCALVSWWVSIIAEHGKCGRIQLKYKHDERRRTGFGSTSFDRAVTAVSRTRQRVQPLPTQVKCTTSKQGRSLCRSVHENYLDRVTGLLCPFYTISSAGS